MTIKEYEDIYESWMNGNQSFCRELIKYKSKQWFMRFQRYLIEEGYDPGVVRKELERMVLA